MVVDILLGIVVGLFLGVIAPLPTFTIDTAFLNVQAQQVGAMASALNGYVPITQIGAALLVLLSLKLALLAWQTIVFIYHQFWGSN